VKKLYVLPVGTLYIYLKSGTTYMDFCDSYLNKT
jgi:hypothetical protein